MSFPSPAWGVAYYAVMAALAAYMVVLVVNRIWYLHNKKTWYGIHPTRREQFALWRGHLRPDVAPVLVARELVRSFPEPLNYPEARVVMEDAVADVKAYATERDVHVAGDWVHRHGLASFEEHLMAGYTDAELAGWLVEDCLPDPTNTEFLAALSPHRSSDTGAGPLTQCVHARGNDMVRIRNRNPAA